MPKILLMLSLAACGLNAATVTINAGFPFSPSSVTVTSGDTVHWQFLGGHDVAETNDPLPGSAVYNGTGFRSVCCSNSTFDLVPQDGPHLYFCEVHGGYAMYGYIFVASPTPTLTPT